MGLHFAFLGRVSYLNFGPSWSWTWPWAVRGQGLWPQLHRGLPHPPPPPAPHHCIQRAAPGLPAALRLSRGPGGRGSRAGPGTRFPPPPALHPRHGGGGSGGLRRMNGPDLAGGAHCSGRGLGGAVSVHLLPHPATPLGALAEQFSLLPPGGRGAGVGWEGRSRGRVGWGQEGEGWGAERAEAAGRPPCARAGPCGVAGNRVPLFRTPAAPHPVRQ